MYRDERGGLKIKLEPSRSLYTTQSKSAYLKVDHQRGQGAEHPFPPSASWGHTQMTGALKQRWS